MKLTRQEIATILAALRVYQTLYGSGLSMPKEIEEIATNQGEISRMNAIGIDALCEKINLD